MATRKQPSNEIFSVFWFCSLSLSLSWLSNNNFKQQSSGHPPAHFPRKIYNGQVGGGVGRLQDVSPPPHPSYCWLLPHHISLTARQLTFPGLDLVEVLKLSLKYAVFRMLPHKTFTNTHTPTHKWNRLRESLNGISFSKGLPIEWSQFLRRAACWCWPQQFYIKTIGMPPRWCRQGSTMHRWKK